MKTVFVDVDTQIDFLYPAGALYVPGAEKLLPALEKLAHCAAERGIPVLSTVDAHAENDPEFRDWPPHCVAGTAGQQKPRNTLLGKRVTVPKEAAEYSIDGAQQIILETAAIDCFTNPNLLGLLARLDADRYVVYGVVTEYCVRCAAMGLLRTGKRVELVTDAVETLRQEDARRTYDEFTAAGGVLAAVGKITQE
ncbi:MAG: cysteine hydrolase [Acidobacteriales bacterium]|nr:cysteine hydrolase [Terriglobales bacterium]